VIDPERAATHRSRAVTERATMHRLLGELATLEKELADLDAAVRAARAAGVKPGQAASAPPPPSRPPGAGATPRTPPGPPPPDPLEHLRRQASASQKQSSASVEDQLAALKRKMAEASKKK
jgi:hypothetical protein